MEIEDCIDDENVLEAPVNVGLRIGVRDDPPSVVIPSGVGTVVWVKAPVIVGLTIGPSELTKLPPEPGSTVIAAIFITRQSVTMRQCLDFYRCQNLPLSEALKSAI